MSEQQAWRDEYGRNYDRACPGIPAVRSCSGTLRYSDAVGAVRCAVCGRMETAGGKVIRESR